MKPESRSRRVLSITQSKAKMFEYNVPLEEHIELTTDPSRLFPLTIGLLGNIAARINDGQVSEDEIQELRTNLPFSARFFDAFVDTKLDQGNEAYVQLLGSAAYYLCNVPGSSSILAKRTINNNLDLGALGLENLLIWLLQIDSFADFPEILDSHYKSLIQTIQSLFIEFNTSGLQRSETIETASRLRILAYDSGTPRQLLMADLIGAIIQRRFENSTWNCLPKYTGLPASEWVDVIKKETFIKEFWPAQHLLGEKGVFRGKSAIVEMPTSAGKTKATEIIIRSAFLANRTHLAVIIAPFRALCHEIRQGLLKAFRKEAIYIDELSDVLQQDYSVDRILSNQQVLIATPEKFNYVLRREPNLAEKIGLIIYDEGHQFDNGTRGITYELLLTSLNAHISNTTQIILISAVISNASQIGQWLIGDKGETIDGGKLVSTFRSIGFATRKNTGRNLYFTNRENPDEIEFFVPRIFSSFSLKRNKIFPDFSKGREIALFLGLKLVHQGSIAIFSGTKNSVTSMCKIIVEAFQNGLSIPPPIEFSDRAEVQKLKYLHDLNLGSNSAITQSTQLGIFAHHNNVPHGLRLSIEYAIKEGLAKFVICTSTLAQGVNLPIRYLIVTSVYQGEEQISIRDFQNLIGRSGRSGMHTEGSILFADPGIYDDRHQNWKGQQNWARVKELLDPSKSEKCDSKLFSLFEPLYGNNSRYKIDIDLENLVEIYLQGPDVISSWSKELADRYGDRFAESSLKKQIASKINIISAIESYLMANWDTNQDTFERESIIALAKGTLAYFLATDEQKQQIEELFVLLAGIIETHIPDIPKRVIFGKTMYGVPDCLSISNWLDEHINELGAEKDELELLNALWPLIANNIHNKNFNKCNRPDIMQKLVISWLEGLPFLELLRLLTISRTKLIAGTQLREYKIEHVVDICENGFAYEGILLLGALIELVPSLPIRDVDSLVRTLQYLQKKLKYGLPNQMQIILYELGFADRVVAIDLSSLLPENTLDKEFAILSLKAKREEVFAKLNLYPSYFSEVYQNQIAKF